VPEGDTIFRAARTLNSALAGHTVTRFETVLPQLSRVDQDTPIAGRTVEGVESQGKWMLMRFSGDLVLLTHMRMNGSWHVYRPGEPWQRGRHRMRIVIETDSFEAVGFDVPVAEFHDSASLARHPSLRRLGPDVLGDAFDPEDAASRLRELGELPVGDALLRQSMVAGIGNVFKSEICFACQVNPFRQVASLSKAELLCLTTKAQEYLRANVTDASRDGIATYSGFRRTTRRANPGARLWVYARHKQPCRRCGTPIESRKQGEAARVTFWCPKCQPLTPHSER
jgi:endonuclease VIII